MHESLLFSAHLRFTKDVEKDIIDAFVEEVRNLTLDCCWQQQHHRLAWCFLPTGMCDEGRCCCADDPPSSCTASAMSTMLTFLLLLMCQQVLQLVELEPIRSSIVGKPGESGLSVEQRKRLTIAVELVANPSIVFMDEPTSGEPICARSFWMQPSNRVFL